MKDVRKADIKFVNDINKAETLNKVAKFISKNAIKSKMILEDKNILKPNDFILLPNAVQNDINLVGKGKRKNKKIDPAQRLRNKIKRMNEKNKLNDLIKKL